MSESAELTMRHMGESFDYSAGPAFDTSQVGSTDRGSQAIRLQGEEALQLVQRLFFVQSEETPRVVLFAGVEKSSGCSEICAAVAETLARITPGTVCLLEANFRFPTLPNFFGTTETGFTDALYRKGPIRTFAKQMSPGNLWFISSGVVHSDSPGALGLESLRTRIAELRSEFDYVIIDVAPLAKYADAMSLGRWVDGMVMVLEANSTRRDLAVTATQSLRAANIEILGAVLNNHANTMPERLERAL